MIDSNMRIRIFVLLFISLITFSCDAETMMSFKVNENAIQLLIKSHDDSEIIDEFNYLPLFEKRIYTFENGSIVGYLPLRNMDKIIQAWSDLNHEFVLFYCSFDGKNYSIIDQGNGWKYRILKSEIGNFFWIFLIDDSEIKIIKILENGIQERLISFNSNIAPDVIKITEEDDEQMELKIRRIDHEEIYRIDWNVNEVILLNEIKKDTF